MIQPSLPFLVGLFVVEGLLLGRGGVYKAREPSATTTPLTTSNAYGSVTASVTVAVNNPTPPTIGTFTAASTSLNVGQGTTLYWSGITTSPTWPTTVTLTTVAQDSPTTPTRATVTGTSQAVTPAETTTYTLTASNAFGSATKQVTVVVVQKPVIEAFWADTSVVQSGATVKLKWGVTNASSLSISGIGAVTGGERILNPTATTTYLLTATNAAGSVTAQVTVYVTPSAGALAWKRSMVYGFGQLISEETAAGVRYMQSDQVGTPNRVLDSAGNLIGLSKTLPFGERFGKSGYSSIRRYTNHEETDDYAIYMQARTLLPAYGKFAQPDPAYDQTKDDPESWNLYNYVTNNPVTHTDPDGRESTEKVEPDRTSTPNTTPNTPSDQKLENPKKPTPSNPKKLTIVIARFGPKMDQIETRINAIRKYGAGTTVKFVDSTESLAKVAKTVSGNVIVVGHASRPSTNSNAVGLLGSTNENHIKIPSEWNTNITSIAFNMCDPSRLENFDNIKEYMTSNHIKLYISRNENMDILVF